MRKLINAFLAGGLALAVIAGASAQNAAVNVGPNANGAFTAVITAAPNFGTVNYSLNDQLDVLGTDLVIRSTHARGGANGWNVTLVGAPFTSTAPAHTFAVSNMNLGIGSTTTVSSVGDATKISTSSGNGIAISGSAQKVISASADHGSNGIFDTTFTGNLLDVPGGTLVGNYTSTLTVAIASAP